MNKTPIAIALERQIPEYIRGEYELFVKFIKAYYEFLDQTQKRDLEDIRSIENTLDEFVIRFKKELSVLFPTNTLANERFVLQRIREFYQAKGSKESYQFLFRILFNKDSDIFYPSTQILRASDGKWIQEKSVFVKITSGDLFNLTGKIIVIKTPQKHIHVFAPRVVYYQDDVYEVFIERAYTQDIFIDSVVMSDDGLNTGVILPCPTKYTITTEGSGFEVGSLYYLKTETGNGSLIKVTKIGTGGSIKKIQVISFGLDYVSTFYAKLSNKKAVAMAYHHPVTSINGSAVTPPFPDGTTGYVDLGYINKQDYFYYDQYYQPTVANNQNVFYADGTYVGEIIGSFYTNADNANVIDNSVAEIKIELGPVAIYPGYYSKSDGFISDECYIQDGKYYQLYSYVIRVEQQIDSYYNLVKDLLHPAGMELYAQYNIKNEYIVAATPLLAFIRRQFLEQEFVTDDDGTNSTYKPVDDISVAYHSDTQDIKDIIAPKSDFTTPADLRYNDVSKIVDILDALVSTADSRYNDIVLSKDDSIIQTETYVNGFTQGTNVDSVTSIEGPRVFELSGNTWKDAVYAIDDTVVPQKIPYYMDTIYTASYYANGIQYPDADVFYSVVTYYRTSDDTVTAIESAKNWDISGATFNQIVASGDSIPVQGNNKVIQESINNTNTGSLYANPYSQDGTSVYDYFASDYEVANITALS